MKFENINDINKLMNTAEVAENFKIETANVLDYCKRGSFTEDEAVLTAVGWFIDPEAAAKRWEKRRNIVDEIKDVLIGKQCVKSVACNYIQKWIDPLLSTERKRKCNISLDNNEITIEFKDLSVIIYNNAEKSNMFSIAAVEKIENLELLVSPRGIETEVYTETYRSKYEAQKRIESFNDVAGWAKFK